MENASQALIIAGAILLAILIIAIGMYIYNSASSNIGSSLDSMTTREIEAFNGEFENYKGKQTGSQISSLVGRLIANASTFKDEASKVPAVKCEKINVNDDKIDGTGITDSTVEYNDASSMDNYLASLAKVKNKLENKHAYYVDFEYADTGLISKIIIKYENE